MEINELIIDYSSEIIIGISLTQKTILFNKTAEKFLHLSKKKVLNKDLISLCASQGLKLPFGYTSLNKLINKKRPVTRKGNIIYPNKTISTFQWTYAFQHADSKKKSYFLILGKKIDALDKKENNAEKINLNKVIENLPEYIYWKDKDLVYQGCNKHVAKYLGLNSPREIVGKTDNDFNWGENRIRILRDIDNKIIKRGITVIDEEVIPRPNHTKRFMLTSKSPLYNETKKVVGVLGVSVDITERKKMEENLKKAKMAAEAANKAKSEFIANMSHDIRTPVTGILGLAQEFYDNSTVTNIKNDAKTLVSATHELLSLLNEIIDVIGLASGEMKTKDENFSLRHLIRHNMNLIKPAIKHKNLNMSLSIEDSIPDYLYGNRRYLDRILLNILGNAVKFTERGSVDIVVTTHSSNDNKIKLKFSIHDTGIGIPKNKQQIIFQHFSRLNPSYQGIYKGSGLGLYTVKKYLREMKGTIHVTSKEGKGSCFIITLPFLISTHIPTPETTVDPVLKLDYKHKNALPSTEPIDDSHIHILAVEDNALAARVLQQTLQKLNCTVSIASSGEKALEAITESDYDLVLMDIGLPGIDGFEATKQIRNLEDKFKAHVPIIALTAHISEQMRQQCLEMGMQDMLVKPITGVTLHQALEKFLPTISQSHTVPSFSFQKEEDNLLTIDLEDGANIGGGDINFAKKMLAMFVENLPKDIEQIDTAYKQNNFALLGKLTHKLYGGLCYCSVPKLRKIIQDLQSATQKSRREEVDFLMKALLEESKEVLRVWKNLKDV